MNPRPYGFDGSNNSLPSRFNSSFTQNDRPTTPMSLIQQSSQEQYKKSLTESLSGFVAASESTQLPSQLSSDLLPKDANFYFVEREKIALKVQDVFAKEKEAISVLFDQYLRQIVGLFEAKREELNVVLDSDQNNFHQFYQKYLQSVTGFLEESMAKLQHSLRADEAFQTAVPEEHLSPLQRNINKLEKEKRISEGRVRAMQEIFNDYNKTNIDASKKVIEHMVVDAPANGTLSGSERTRTSVNKRVLASSLDGVIAMIAQELKTLRHSEEVPRPTAKIEIPHFIPQPGPPRMMSPALWEKLNPDKSQLMNAEAGPGKKLGLPHFSNFSGNKFLNRPSSCEPMGSSIMNLNLESQMKQQERKVHWQLPTIAEEKKSDQLKTSLGLGGGHLGPALGDAGHLKQSSANMGGSNGPVNPNSYINIYNAQNASQKETNSVYQRLGVGQGPKAQSSMDALAQKRTFRPLSGNLKPLNNFYLNRQTKELDLTTPITPATMSILKTNILSKSSNMPRKFRTNLLLNDYSSKINCFEIDPKNSLLILGTSSGTLLINKVDLRTMTLLDEKVVQLSYTPSSDPKRPSGVIMLGQSKPGVVLAVTSGMDEVLYAVDVLTGTIVTRFKTFRESIKLLAYYDSSGFIMIAVSEKILLYSYDQPTPKRSFKIPITDLVDICMSSPRTAFIISASGELRIVKLGANVDSPIIEGHMKVEGKVVSLDVFYNNEKMLLVHSQTKEDDLIFILNTASKKIMKTIQHPRQFSDVYAYSMITLCRTGGDVFLAGVGENEMKYWEIDGKATSHEIESESGESFHLKSDNAYNGKLVKMMGYNAAGQIVAVGLCTQGVMSFTLI